MSDNEASQLIVVDGSNFTTQSEIEYDFSKLNAIIIFYRSTFTASSRQMMAGVEVVPSEPKIDKQVIFVSHSPR